MKRILFLVCFFIFALIAGFFFADALDLFKDENSDISENVQINYLLIRVDDLSKPKPVLQTVWGIFTSFSGQTSIYFQPIYPSSNNRVDLRSLFSLDQSGKPADTFLKELEKFDLSLNGYLVLDDRGAQTFLDWLTSTETVDHKATSNPSFGQLSLQRTQLAQVCKGITGSSFMSNQPFKWELVYPEHLTSSPKNEVIIPLFNRVFFQSTRVECHVLE